MAGKTAQLRVRSITYLADEIHAYELVDPDGTALTPFTAGAHIDVFLPGSKVRQYSLANDPAETHRYVFAVQREAAGDGGSKAVFDMMQVGRIVSIGGPRNNFPIDEGADRHILLAGGIGITPMMSMLRRLHCIGADFKMYYCTRNEEKTAFREALAPHVEAGRVEIHHDDGDPANGLDFGTLFETHLPGTHLYFCGPTGFMRAAHAATQHWPNGTVHCEYFKPDEKSEDSSQAIDTGKAEFQIKLAKSGAVYDVPSGKSIVQVLREQGVDVETSCESGLCGTCRTRYLEGEPVHQDYVLDDDEQDEFVMICSARCKTPLLVLDI